MFLSFGREKSWFKRGSSPEEDPESLSDEYPQHLVRLDKPVWFQATALTWRQVIALKPARKKLLGYLHLGYNRLDYRATCIRYDEFVELAYIASHHLRHWFGLPTEAEWELAARTRRNAAVPGMIRPFDDGIEKIRRHTSFPKVVAVMPGIEGLYDMMGFWQWVNDWYGNYPRLLSYKGDTARPIPNPRGPEAGTQRVFRGGWVGVGDLRPALRLHVEPNQMDLDLGARFVTGSNPNP